MPDTKILLEENEIPTHWYNVVADMPNKPAPPLGPDGNPVGPDKLLAIFPMPILEQEMSVFSLIWLSMMSNTPKPKPDPRRPTGSASDFTKQFFRSFIR